jgi:hypothetical protein
MERVVVAAAILLAAGCQAQNPFAAIGPSKVAPPATSQALPYYPAGGAGVASGRGGAGAGPAAAERPARISVSAEGAARTGPPQNTIVAEPADREPIRIVENPSGAARTANAARNALPPGGTPGGPASGASGGDRPLPAKAVPAAGGNSSGQALPATSRMRGFTNRAAGSGRELAPGSSPVSPANYQQAVPSFSETPAAGGQWRAR